MDMESRGAGDRELQRKTKAYKRTLQALRTDFEKAQNSQERSNLFGGAGRDEEMGGNLTGEQKGRLENTGDKIGRQNDTLDNARRVMAETEDVALEITEELARNREKIQASRDKVLDVSSMTNQARRLVHSMSKRETQQRIIMFGFAFVLVGIIVLIIYYTQKK